MMKVLLLTVFLISSCTMKKDRGVHRKDLIIWNLEKTYKTTSINNSLKLFYKTCFDSKDRKYDFWESLRVKFKEKFGIELIGLSEAESRSFYVQETVCLHINGHPVTVKPFKTPVTELEIHDPNHQIH